MSGSAHSGFDDKSFYEADIGETTVLSATAVGVQTADAVGALPPGRYLVQARTFSDPTATCWILTGKYVASTPIALAASAGAQRIPLSPEVPGVEFHVRKGYSDRVGAITSAGTATVYLTRISTKV